MKVEKALFLGNRLTPAWHGKVDVINDDDE
jgi:hypothetical protein